MFGAEVFRFLVSKVLTLSQMPAFKGFDAFFASNVGHRSLVTSFGSTFKMKARMGNISVIGKDAQLFLPQGV